jgi:hypothetical protein
MVDGGVYRSTIDTWIEDPKIVSSAVEFLHDFA